MSSLTWWATPTSKPQSSTPFYPRCLTSSVDHFAIRCAHGDRGALIAELVQVYRGEKGRAIVFTETKQEATDLALTALKQVC